MGEHLLSKALDHLLSSIITEKQIGINYLKEVFSRNRRNGSQSVFDDQLYYKALKSIFANVQSDASSLRDGSKLSKTKAIARLSDYSSILRQIVESGLKHIRHKTVKATSHHILQTVALVEDLGCETLVQEYLTALRLILSYAPHSEHLSKEWPDLVRFCNERINTILSAAGENDASELAFRNGSSRRFSRRSRSTTPTSISGSFSSSHHSVFKQSSSKSPNQKAEDLLFCLAFLLAIPQAPLFEFAKPCLDSISEILETLHSAGAAHAQEAAFTCVNSILSASLTENIGCAEKAVEIVVYHSRRIWDAKNHRGLRESMLLNLINSERILHHMVRKESPGQLKLELEKLLIVLRNEYSKKSERELLELDDVILDTQSRSSLYSPLDNGAFLVKPGRPSAEVNWAILHTIAVVFSLVQQRQGDSSITQEEELPKKRRRLESPVNAFLRKADLSFGVEKLAVIQILAFIVTEQPLSEDDCAAILEYALPLISAAGSKSVIGTSISAWAMILVSWYVERPQSSVGTTKSTSVAGQSPSKQSPRLLQQWNEAWKLGSRVVASVSTCRPASFMMFVLLDYALVEYEAVSNSIDAMVTSIDLNGPATLNDTSSKLWVVLLQATGRHKPALLQRSSEQVLRWVFNRWRPSQAQDKYLDPRSNQICATVDILNILLAVAGMPVSPHVSLTRSQMGIVARSRAKFVRSLPLIDFLLFQDSQLQTDCRKTSHPSHSSGESNNFDFRFRNIFDTILDFLHSETSALLGDDSFSVKDGLSQKIVDSAVRSIASLCIVNFSLSSHPYQANSARSKELQVISSRVIRRLVEIVSGSGPTSNVADTLVWSVGSLLDTSDSSCLPPKIATIGATITAKEIGKVFWQRLTNVESTQVQEEGLMDVEDNFEPRSQTQPELGVTSLPHDWLGAETSYESISVSFKVRALLAALVHDQPRSTDFVAGQIPNDFVAHITQLSVHDFLCCRGILKELLSSIDSGNAKLIAGVLAYLGQDVLEESYEFQRSEVALGACLDIMTTTARIWAIAEGDVAEYASQIYEWFTNVLPPQLGICSPHAHLAMSQMLHQLIKFQPDYARHLSLESPRTMLFKILEEGSAKVKFAVCTDISSIFSLFILKEHESILDDVITSLPLESEWVEGTATRLFALSHLGSSWPTLIRRCLYAIVEAPVLVPACEEYAKACLKRLSAALHLESSRDLFRLFSSQIAYTWLGTQSLGSIPYNVFEYENLGELVRDVQNEIVAQIAMRGREDEVELVQQILNTPYKTLLERAFSKSAAYCISRDAAIAPDVDPIASGGATRLRNVIGKQRYAELIETKFPEILANFFKVIDREDSIVKGFQKHEGHARANSVYDEIISSGASPTSAVSQQPSFKATCLVDEIDYICSRSSRDPNRIWTPALYIYVFRELIDTIHPALGPLHTCAVLRRIRILVSVAGDVALQSYPLEMALHCLRSFLTDVHCAEDVIGIFRYLTSHGIEHLRETPNFVTGLLVSTLASLRIFLEAPQESTTQDSQFRATISNAKDFHNWLGAFARSYSSPQLNADSTASFQSIMTAACQIREKGNARVGTYESELLKLILEDQASGRKLVSSSSKDLIMNLLCSNFERPESSHDDILGDRAMAFQYASVLWNTIGEGQNGKDYNLWVARVLGRAYSGSGFVDNQLIRETPAYTSSETFRSSQPVHLTKESRAAILAQICVILNSENLRDIGMSERSLQSIAAKSGSDECLCDCLEALPESLFKSLVWKPFKLPDFAWPTEKKYNLSDVARFDGSVSSRVWTRNLALALVQAYPRDALLPAMSSLLTNVHGLSERVFPYVLHLALLSDSERCELRELLSRVFTENFKAFEDRMKTQAKQLINAILYLRTQARPHEMTQADRSQWLEIDFKSTAEVAEKCGMHKTALLFLEVSLSDGQKTRSSRRSSSAKVKISTDLLIRIFRNLDDTDMFYGVRQPSSLSAMMEQLEFENAGFKSLSFRGSSVDSQIRFSGEPSSDSEESLVRLLGDLDLNSLSESVLLGTKFSGSHHDAIFQTARKLERWDIPCPSGSGQSVILFRVFQNLFEKSTSGEFKVTLDSSIHSVFESMMEEDLSSADIFKALSSLAVLTDIEDVLSAKGADQIQETWAKLKAPDWMSIHRLENVDILDSCRKTLFSVISKSQPLQNKLRISSKDARRMEVESLLASSKLNRDHRAFQTSLGATTYLAQVVQPCQHLGLTIDAAARFEASNVLWDQGEMSSSIHMLREIIGNVDLLSQDVRIGRPELLAKLGHRVAEARLEQPEEIISSYLMPAIAELQGVSEGAEAGQVFHEFASFCDQQLQDPDDLEDFSRVQMMRDRKNAEVQEIAEMISSSTTQAREREQLKMIHSKAKKWLELDNREYQRLISGRQTLLSRSLENYLRGLRACDTYENDALRFSALWLEHYEDEAANSAVANQLSSVPSRKFAPLMNQWTSRLLDIQNNFQGLLSELVLRICTDHPYHGMYHIFTSSKSRGAKDPTALSRNAAANKVVSRLKSEKRTTPTWLAIHNSNIAYVRFATEKLDAKFKQGSRVPLHRIVSGQKLEQDVNINRIPPPTMTIHIRPDCNYSQLPVVQRFQSEFSVASGISAPKILTAISSEGKKFKQLLKSGNDDLRQDAIMEQVFEQVSNLLKSNKDTRQRKLGIRTYKVLPLTAQAGIIEFVSNTIPLHDYLMPAHARHFPNDLKSSACRKAIADVQTRPNDYRVQIFRTVCEKFHPVLRFFFTETFESPDDWFDKRQAYTRSTATISMLGHVLGLGDRHGHNILLDEKTGEVVHIDLGIAFEQGRILPIPEVVPFRLTRDLVDGMGITKTEGVFRRCCEFTLEALRNEAYSIRTILDVLRYDPLYSWSASPLRLKRLQADQTEAAAFGRLREDEVEKGEKKDEEGEADRALTVVVKKLSKSLSVTATVNELIQQATDERNLALLFCGWAAYA